MSCHFTALEICMSFTQTRRRENEQRRIHNGDIIAACIYWMVFDQPNVHANEERVTSTWAATNNTQPTEKNKRAEIKHIHFRSIEIPFGWTEVKLASSELATNNNGGHRGHYWPFRTLIVISVHFNFRLVVVCSSPFHWFVFSCGDCNHFAADTYSCMSPSVVAKGFSVHPIETEQHLRVDSSSQRFTKQLNRRLASSVQQNFNEQSVTKVSRIITSCTAKLSAPLISMGDETDTASCDLWNWYYLLDNERVQREWPSTCSDSEWN